MDDIPQKKTIGQRVMSAATRVTGLRENQMAILEWLFAKGHLVDDDEFSDELYEAEFHYVLTDRGRAWLASRGR